MAMTVVQLISSEGLYGAESMLIALSRALTDRGFRVVIGVFQDSRSPHTEVADFAGKLGLTVRLIPCQGRWDFKTVAAIRELLGDLKADILHTHGYKADLYGYAASYSHRVVLISTCHNWPSKRLVMKMYAAWTGLSCARSIAWQRLRQRWQGFSSGPESIRANWRGLAMASIPGDSVERRQRWQMKMRDSAAR